MILSFNLNSLNISYSTSQNTALSAETHVCRSRKNNPSIQHVFFLHHAVFLFLHVNFRQAGLIYQLKKKAIFNNTAFGGGGLIFNFSC